MRSTAPDPADAVKVTVGIPTFNRAAWLRESIESVLAQTFTSFRLIVGDNASDDDTEDVVRSFGDERIDYVRSARNVGAIGNFNRLIALADTEFLAVLPDDDVLYPDHLATSIELLDRFESVGVAHSAFELIDAQSRVIRRVKPWMAYSSVTIDRRDRTLERLMAAPICFSSVVYRTKAIVEAGGFREAEEPFCDQKMWMRMALDWDFGYIAKPLVGSRIHRGTITATIAAQHGVTSDGHEDDRLYSQINYQRRMEFLDDARLGSRRTEALRALAKLQLLVDSAYVGLPWDEAAAGLVSLVRAHPRILLRPKLWRFVVAQLGARRLRFALAGVYTRHRGVA
jgi:glycosyltransferase involved in cell wall biosynthesis